MTSPHEGMDGGRCESCERPGLYLWPDTGECWPCSDRPDPGADADRVAAFGSEVGR